MYLIRTGSYIYIFNYHIIFLQEMYILHTFNYHIITEICNWSHSCGNKHTLRPPQDLFVAYKKISFYYFNILAVPWTSLCWMDKAVLP